jgi:MATE family multidrug resistance protein
LFVCFGCSTRVSNELGAGNPKTAKGAVRVVVIIGIAEAIIVSTFFICFRNILGYAYSNDEQVVNYIADMVPLLCVSVSADSLIGALSGKLYIINTNSWLIPSLKLRLSNLDPTSTVDSRLQHIFIYYFMWTVGVARGGGFQQMGAYVNLGAYYLVGIPLGLLLGFYLKLNAKGLWMGTLSGSIVNVIILATVTALTDWQKEVCFLILPLLFNIRRKFTF